MTTSSHPLHLIDQASPQAHPTALALIASRGEPAVLLGNQQLQHAAEVSGLVDATCLRVPAGSATWGLPVLRQFLRGVEPGRELHVWSLSCLTALKRLGRTSCTVMHMLTPLTPRQLQRMKRLDRSTLRWLVPGELLREQLIAQGFTPERIGLQTLPTLEQAGAMLQHDRASLRERWGVDDEMPVVALLSDPPTAAQAPSMMTGLNLVSLAADRPLRLLVHPEQHGRSRTQTLLDRYGEPDRFIQDTQIATPWAVLRGCDAVMLSEQPAPLSVRYALAAGLPVVAPDLPLHREALAKAAEGQAHYALTAEPKRMADRLQHRALGLPTHRFAYGSAHVG
ncbi:hypothetical protein [Algisphaera agarilytica]|uniref:Uncharacterized protein n=1 Tax=Algisphaera agarilytica TaxID=1385975 RepID=A0A7X0H3Q1_9BACT|nr:hypothetical protein [Algisphaera agarilytica]MBB6428696.1 hypothetical protein [Algisphaera agarilytica]